MTDARLRMLTMMSSGALAKDALGTKKVAASLYMTMATGAGGGGTGRCPSVLLCGVNLTRGSPIASRHPVRSAFTNPIVDLA